MVLRSLALPLAFFAATPALAQQAPPVDDGGDVIVLGAGAAILPDYEGSDDSRWAPVPAAMGRISGFNFQLVGNRASVDLIRDSSGPGWDPGSRRWRRRSSAMTGRSPRRSPTASPCGSTWEPNRSSSRCQSPFA